MLLQGDDPHGGGQTETSFAGKVPDELGICCDWCRVCGNENVGVGATRACLLQLRLDRYKYAHFVRDTLGTLNQPSNLH